MEKEKEVTTKCNNKRKNEAEISPIIPQHKQSNLIKLFLFREVIPYIHAFLSILLVSNCINGMRGGLSA